MGQLYHSYPHQINQRYPHIKNIFHTYKSFNSSSVRNLSFGLEATGYLAADTFDSAGFAYAGGAYYVTGGGFVGFLWAILSLQNKKKNI